MVWPGEDAPINHRWDLFKESPDLVQQRFDDMREYSLDGYNMAFDAIKALEQIAHGLALINRVIPLDTTTIEGELDDRSDDEPDFDESLYRVDSSGMPPDPTGLENAVLDPIPTDYPTLVGPGTVNEGDLEYVSDLMTKLQAKIMNDLIYGSTGLTADVENAIFNRNYERDLVEYDDELDRIAANWSRGGCPYPNGGLRAAQDRITREFSNKRTDVSRDIMIKSWELALQNTHFIIAQGIAIESLMIKWAEAVGNRVLDASKATIDANLRTYEVSWKGFSDRVKTIIDKAMAKIQYNLGLIRIFEAKVNAYASKMKAESDRVSAVARGDEAEVAVFNSLINFDIQKVNLNLKVIEAKIQQATANAHILIKDKEIEIKAYEALNQLKAEAQKAIGSIAAQVAAGALSAVHAQVSIGASNSADYYYNPNQVPAED